MNRNPFGWDYPPGAAGDPAAPWNQVDAPCDICQESVDGGHSPHCECPPCPECGEIGRRECIDEHPTFAELVDSGRVTVRPLGSCTCGASRRSVLHCDIHGGALADHLAEEARDREACGFAWPENDYD